ncbi:hypothetical protein A1F97_06164 [Pyrenophora tritici-repentis]|nr:hypothetical protein PtrSN001C_004513 [Pyrenophora tritici-repentis]KAI1571438.1 hypothetical protein PtrEW4_004770 [Pyrenophora tritici-repentis]KAI1603150.1 hypothetical protein PtrCC142_004659 [Pyrenophora tritici-repentis]PZD39094.1 hypothetical protein A1F97_06164 [Pyrenophora tritici-repentis]
MSGKGRDGRTDRLTVEISSAQFFIVFVKIPFDSSPNTSDVSPDHRNRGTTICLVFGFAVRLMGYRAATSSGTGT